MTTTPTQPTGGTPAMPQKTVAGQKRVDTSTILSPPGEKQSRTATASDPPVLPILEPTSTAAGTPVSSSSALPPAEPILDQPPEGLQDQKVEQPTVEDHGQNSEHQAPEVPGALDQQDEQPTTEDPDKTIEYPEGSLDATMTTRIYKWRNMLHRFQYGGLLQ